MSTRHSRRRLMGIDYMENQSILRQAILIFQVKNLKNGISGIEGQYSQMVVHRFNQIRFSIPKW